MYPLLCQFTLHSLDFKDLPIYSEAPLLIFLPQIPNLAVMSQTDYPEVFFDVSILVDFNVAQQLWFV